MKTEIKEKWVVALRSGAFAQARSRLSDGNGGFCCLGVLCKVIHPGDDPKVHSASDAPTGAKLANGFLDTETLNIAGLIDEEQKTLSGLNDVREWDFARIADWVESNL